MRFSVFFLFLTVLSVAIANNAQTTAPENDFQVWSDFQVSIPVLKSKDKKEERLSIQFYGTLRGGGNFTEFIDERIGLGLEVRLNKNFSFTPSYVYRSAQPLAGRREYESRIRFDLGFEKKFKNFTIKDRNRIEHRFRNSRTDSTRYRHKFQILFPLKQKGKELFTPFLADEVFYEFQAKKFVRNEFSIGINKKFNKNTSADFYYALQNNRGNSLKYINVLGISLKFKID